MAKIKEKLEPIVEEEKLEPIVEEEKLEYNKKLDYASRGFNSLEEAINFVNSDRFKNWGEADKAEHLDWLKK